MTWSGFPSRPQQLTTGWLTRMLQEAGVLPGGVVVRGFSARSIGEGVGMVSRVVRVDLSYPPGPGGGPGSVVMKFAHEAAANRAIGRRLRVYRQEVTFYRRVAPLVAVPKPACYFAGLSPQTGDCLIVLEDLGDHRPGDQLAGLTAGEAKRVVDALVPLHAAYWGNTDQDVLREVMRVGSTFVEPYARCVDQAWNTCMTRFGDCIPDPVGARLADYVAGLRRLHTVMAQGPQTLVHGDTRLDNIMFNDRDPRHPVALIDWQSMMVTNPLHDLALMLSMSASTGTRRAIEEDLVGYYHTGLVRHGVTGYGLARCRADYDLALLYVMSVALVMGGAFQPANDRGRLLARRVLRRACTAVLDRGLLPRIPGHDTDTDRDRAGRRAPAPAARAGRLRAGAS